MTKGNNRLAVICDGEIEFCLLDDKDIEEVIEVLEKSFFLYENLCIATGVDQPQNKAAVTEISHLARQIAKDGISIIARHIPSGRIAGVALNKIHESCKENISVQEEFLENFLDSTCETEIVKCIMKSLESVEKKFDIFKEWNVDCIVEHFMLSTLPEFGKRNIGYNLCLHSLQLAMELEHNNRNICQVLPKHLQHCRPKAIYAIFTSHYSHKIGKGLGFKDLASIPMSEFSYNGIRFSEKLDPIHKGCTLAAKKF